MLASRSGDSTVETRNDLIVRAVLAGFIATAAMTLTLLAAYGLATVLGSPSPTAPPLSSWLWGLSHNVVTAQMEGRLPLAALLHVFAGMGWAVMYGTVVEPRLTGPGWRKGLTFAPIPAVASLVIFLPVLGGGLFGFGLGAGPLPLVGNVLLHALYGVTLGHFYEPESDHLLVERGDDDTDHDLTAVRHARQAIAIGIVAGFVVGGLLGTMVGLLGSGTLDLVAIMFGAFLGSSGGALIGSYSGLASSR